MNKLSFGYVESDEMQSDYSHALRKEVIIIYDKDKLNKKLPFDINFIRTRITLIMRWGEFNFVKIWKGQWNMSWVKSKTFN